ncbi:MAG: sigma-70 family RNA polymerase sigma factor [Thermoleophilaceae bacterium]|nr:sigma-70 family RNA polymerase sigma factor [Thermoleophilaceae bacterium]
MNPATLRTRRATNFRNLDRLELDRVATELVVKYGSLILQDASRFSANASDAEDAYQRSLEILLTKAPTTDPDQLIPWLRTVVRNEALAIARSRHNTHQELKPEHADTASPEALPTDDVVESLADLERGAEALKHLSEDQVTCLIAQSAGMSYDEIVAATGFTRRKVTRCIENGRHAFTRKVDAIAAGTECERMEPLIHKLLNGDAEAAINLRPHLRHCLACRGRLRAYDSAPRNVAALFPPSLVVVGYPHPGFFARVADWCQAVADRIAMQLLGAEKWAEASGAKKVAIVATVATATAGGGAAVHSTVDRDRTDRADASSEVRSAAVAPPVERLVDPIEVARPAPSHSRKRAHKKKAKPTKTLAAPAQPVAPPRPAETQTNTEIDDGSAEFLPEERSAP